MTEILHAHKKEKKNEILDGSCRQKSIFWSNKKWENMKIIKIPDGS